MDTLFSRHRNAMVLVAVLFLQLVLLAFQVKRDKDVPLIRIWAVALITPFEKFASFGIRGVGGLWTDYVDLRSARRESYRLAEEVGRLKLSHQQLREEALEARRLKALLDFRGEIPSQTVAARVIGSSASETSRVLFIDQGSNAGIRPNMPVITPDGIVGKVHRVFWSSSQVLVITDPDSGVGALLEKSRVHGALRGHSGFFCQLRYIVTDEKVEVGERVYTSGEDLIYPKGLPIGVVTTAKPGNVFKEITVQPFARLNRLEEVLVIVRKVDQEILTRPGPEGTATAEAAVPVAPPPTSPAARPATPGGLPATSAPAPAAANQQQQPPDQSRRQPLPGMGDGARARPETDADKLLEAYRAAAAKKTGAAAAAAAAPAARPPAGGTQPDQAPRPGPAAPPSAQGTRTPPAAPAPAPDRKPETQPQPPPQP